MESVVVDQVNVADNGIVFYRLTKTDEQGMVTYVRGALTPGQNLFGLPSEVAEQCQAVWTEEMIAVYNAAITLR